MAKRRDLPADDDRCTRTDGKRWRCPDRRLRDHRYCRKHHLLYLATLDRLRASKPSSRVSVRAPEPSPAFKNEKKTPRARARASKPSLSSSAASRKERKNPRARVSPPAGKESVGDGEDSSQELLNSVPEGLELGQIWALADETDCYPRVYARVEKINAEKGTAEVTLLEPHPVSEDEMRWAEEGVPAACGTFRATKLVLVALATFSHQMVVEEESTGKAADLKKFYKIFPREGEVWAVYQRWNEGRRNLVYKLVEVVSGFTEEGGVTVAALRWVPGTDAIFERQVIEGFELVRTLSRKELLRFSHQTVAFKVMDDERNGGGGGGGGGRGGRWKVMFLS